MAEKVPRRLMRFNRDVARPSENEETQAPARRNEIRQDVQEEKPKEEFGPTGRRILKGLPSMKYEDLDAATKKDYATLKNTPVRTAAEELALKEVENFKRKNNRLPNKEESETIADSLYSQLKNVDTDALYGIKKPAQKPTEREERKRGRAQRGQKKEADEFKEPAPQSGGSISNVKKLLEDEEGTQAGQEKSDKDEFDLGLGESGEGSEELKDLEEEDDAGGADVSASQTCPNCKKETTKVIYCPKCGAAFCALCAKKDSSGFICPKCGTKIKK